MLMTWQIEVFLGDILPACPDEVVIHLPVVSVLGHDDRWQAHLNPMYFFQDRFLLTYLKRNALDKFIVKVDFDFPVPNPKAICAG
jgi:hypothetical protein